MSLSTTEAGRVTKTYRAGVARRVFAEVRRADELGQRRLAKVTSLHRAFRLPGVPGASAKALTEQLLLHGVCPEPRLEDAARTGTVELSLCPDQQRTPPSRDVDRSIRVSIWRPGEPGVEQPLAAPLQRSDGAVLWFDVEPALVRDALPKTSIEGSPSRLGLARRRSPNGPSAATQSSPSPASLDQRVAHVFQQLQSWCDGLEEEMVRDLLQEDRQPKVVSYGHERDGARGVSAVAVVAREAPGDPTDLDRVSEELVFQLVEGIFGGGWIITCWHPTAIYTGPGEPERGHSLLQEPFVHQVRHGWVQESTREKTAGDLGIYLARALVDTYAASHRMIERWVEGWELDFYATLSDAKTATVKSAAFEISNTLSMVGEFRRRITAFDHARYTTWDKTWFPGLGGSGEGTEGGAAVSEEVGALASYLQATEKNFDVLFESIRADMDLLMLQSVGTQQESSEKLNLRLGKMTALVLVPTLVAGIFGANTQIPGEGRWTGFEIMVLLMITSALAVYLPMRQIFHDREVSRQRFRERRRAV